MKRLQISNNIYVALLSRLGIILFLYSVLRILFYSLNYHYFESISGMELYRICCFGMLFDASAIIFINSLYILLQVAPFNFRSNKSYQFFAEIIFYLTNTIGIIFNCVDLVFFRFIFRRTTFDVIKGSIIGDDLQSLFWNYLYDYWYVVVIAIALVATMVYLYRKTKKVKHTQIKTVKQFLLSLLWFVLFIGSSLCIARGGFRLRPLSLINAGEYTNPQNAPLLVNTPFSIFSTLEMKSLDDRKYFSNIEARNIFNPIVQNKVPSGESFRHLNIVIIIVESLSREYIGSLNRDIDNGNYKGYTPFLDSLIQHSMVMEHAFSNGKRSIEGIPSVASGLPSLMNDAYITSMFSGNKVNSLPLILKREGYASAFYHGGKNGTMNFDAYAKMAGFDAYYGKNEYNNDNDFDGKWGIYDEEFLQYAANMMTKTKPPFFSTIFTLSSHHPYTIPPKYKNTFPKGTLEIHESIGYTDHALKDFFHTCQQLPWFDSTLFVITADHSSLAYNSYYQNNLGTYAIPIIYYMHNNPQMQGIRKTITQQADILPSLLDFVHYKDKYVAFGSSVFDSAAPHFAISYLNSSYQLIKDGFVLQFNGEKATALYDMTNDRLLQHNLLLSNPSKTHELEQFTKALIQAYNQRMLQNKLSDTHE